MRGSPLAQLLLLAVSMEIFRRNCVASTATSATRQSGERDNCRNDGIPRDVTPFAITMERAHGIPVYDAPIYLQRERLMLLRLLRYRAGRITMPVFPAREEIDGKHSFRESTHATASNIGRIDKQRRG